MDNIIQEIKNCQTGILCCEDTSSEIDQKVSQSAKKEKESVDYVELLIVWVVNDDWNKV